MLATIAKGRDNNAAVARASHVSCVDAVPWITIRMCTVFGLATGLVTFVGMISINGAVVASGTVPIECKYKTIQHPDGGVVASIHIKNAELVEPRQRLVTLMQKKIARTSQSSKVAFKAEECDSRACVPNVITCRNSKCQ